MSPHPCDGHACDHCYRCDVLGECCQTATARRTASRPVDVASPDPLHAAILRDAGTVPSLAGLVRLEAHQYPVGLVAATRLGLLAAPKPPLSTFPKGACTCRNPSYPSMKAPVG